jgi:hypothetical protein
MGVLIEDIESRPVHRFQLMGAGDLDHLCCLGESVSVGLLTRGSAHGGEFDGHATRLASGVATSARLVATSRPFSGDCPPV